MAYTARVIWARTRTYSFASALLDRNGACTGFPVKGLMRPPFALVNEARLEALPDGSMIFTLVP